jgi:hypothetical protein
MTKIGFLRRAIQQNGGSTMTERVTIGGEDFEIELPDAEAGIMPGLDLQLGSDEEAAGNEDQAGWDEENMFGNDVVTSAIDANVDDDERVDDDVIGDDDTAYPADDATDSQGARDPI